MTFHCQLSGALVAAAALTAVAAPAQWVQREKITVSSLGAAAGVGVRVALAGDRALLGTSDGAAIPVERGAFGWIQSWAKLEVTGLASFGQAVAVAGAHSLVGGPFDYSGDGQVTMFHDASVVWWQTDQELGAHTDENFGYALAAGGSFAVVGAPGYDDRRGRAYVLQRSGDAWSIVDQLSPGGLQAGDEFGKSVAIYREVGSTRIVVGAPRDEDDGRLAGAIYVFKRDLAGNWDLEDKLKPSDGFPDRYFGTSVAIDGERIAASHTSVSGVGAVYIFRLDGSGDWVEQVKIDAPLGASSGNFGKSIALEGKRLVVGAPSAASGEGAAFVYRRIGGTWTNTYELTADDGAANDLFGCSVALSGDVILVGAPQDDDHGTDSGAAYVFEYY